jgi:hypothetical protein
MVSFLFRLDKSLQAAGTAFFRQRGSSRLQTGNQAQVFLQIQTGNSLVGASINTPTTVAREAPEKLDSAASPGLPL